jgi:hypothetical protein
MLLIVEGSYSLLLSNNRASIGCTARLCLSGSGGGSIGDFVGMVHSGLDDLLLLGIETTGEGFVDALLFLLQSYT